MQQPPGFIHPQYTDRVCRLHKALYGLKLAPRAWYSRLSDKLLYLDFTNAKSDASLFVYQSAQLMIYILVYVDDILILGSS